MLNSMSSIFKDTWVVTKRNLIKYRRVPQLLIFSTIQPVMILVLFNYVFGGAIQLPPGVPNYIQFVLAGVMLQITMFGITSTTVGLAEDLTKGLIDRFRSLPMSRIAVLAGWTLSAAIRTFFVTVILLVVAAIIGFRFQDGPLSAIISILVVVLFGFSMAWVAAWVGLKVKDVETAQASFVWVFPFVFASGIFVPTDTMPDWLRAFAENQPVTVVVDAVRAFMLGGDHSLIWPALAWITSITIFFMVISVRAYRRSTS